VLAVKPGITGLSQVKYRHEEALLQRCRDLEAEYLSVIMPRKLELDLAYVRDQSLALDLALIGQTVACLFRKEPTPELDAPGDKGGETAHAGGKGGFVPSSDALPTE
jgi:lipopolysaccharide/colanic/teichoic acid biosynthesis glycosyltransferase